MPYVIETYRPNGTKVMDGYSKAGLFVEVLTLVHDGGASGSKVYTQVPAGFLYVSINGYGSEYTVTVDSDGLGNARVNWTFNPNSFSDGYWPNQGAVYVIVFARKITRPPGYGGRLFNNQGDVLVEYGYPVPQYVGTVQPAASPTLPKFGTEAYNSPTGTTYAVSLHKVLVDISPTTHRVVTINMPDSTSNDHWYTVDPSFIPANATVYRNGAWTNQIEVTVTVIHPINAAYRVPTLHIFSLNGPIVGGQAFAMQCFKESAVKTYDSSANNVSITDQKPLKYNHDNGGFNSMAFETPSVAGLLIPYMELQFYEYFDQPDINGNEGRPGYWIGAAQRRGGTLHYAYHLYYYPARPASVWSRWTRTGTPNGTTALSVDISQFSPNTIAGT